MKKLVYILMAMALCIACSHRKQSKATGSKDSMVTVFCLGEPDRMEIPLDSFLQIKDSFVYCKEEELWMTKELYKWDYVYPDTITVAFTRNGKFVDSVQAVRTGVIYNSRGELYSPAYVMMGNGFVYRCWDVNGKLIRYSIDDPNRDSESEYYEY